MISVVVPVYNHARYLPECIDSILAQDRNDVDLIVIDDGSTDATPEVIQRYQRYLRCVRQSNQGQSAALNRGWAMARGSVLAYLSADDVLLPGAVAAALDVLASDPSVAMTYCDYQLLDPNSRVIRVVRTAECSFQSMIAEFVVVAGPGMFFRRNALDIAGPWDTSLRKNPDVDFIFRLRLAGRFHRIPRVLAGFRSHAQSQTGQRPDAARAEEPVAIITKFFSRPDLPSGMMRLRRPAFASAHVVSARHHLRAGRWRPAWEHLSAAARCHPRTLLSSRTARVLVGAYRYRH